MRNVEDYIISSGINKMDMHIVQVTRKGMHRNFNLKWLICLISHKINCLFHTWMDISLINLRNDRLGWYLQEESKTTITLNINQPLNFVLMVIQECSGLQEMDVGESEHGSTAANILRWNIKRKMVEEIKNICSEIGYRKNLFNSNNRITE